MNWKCLLVLAALAPTAAFGQARVVTTCGNLAPFGPQPAGSTAYVTQDTNGQLCLSGGGGGGGITSITAGTTPTTGFAAGQLMMSDGTLTQGSSYYASSGSGMSVLNPAPSFYTLINGDNTGSRTLAYNFTAFNAGRANTWNIRGASLDVQAGTAADSLRVYNTYTDASNGEWGTFDWQTTPNVLTIGTQANGTGTARNINFVLGGSIIASLANTINALSVNGISIPGGGYYITIGTGSGIRAPVLASNGTSPSIVGAGGTCATSTVVGGTAAGTVVLSGVCASTNTIAFTGMVSSINGYVCDAQDRTTRTAGPFIESASTLTGFTLTVGATSSVAGDVLQWKCIGY